MKIYSKAIAIPAAALALAGGLYLTGTSVQAQEASSGRHETIVQELSSRFGLDQSELESFFDEKKADKKAEMAANAEDRLAQAVEAGELTQTQVDAILAKRDELQAQREQDRAELEAWAEENGIDMKYLRPEGRHGGKNGPSNR